MSDPIITLSDGTTTLALDPDLYWSDEYGWAATAQTVETGLTGAPILHLGLRQYGRPITLRPYDERSAWLTRADMAQLKAWADIPGKRLTLTLRGETHTVIFRHHDGGPFEADPVWFVADPDPTDYVLATIRLMTVAPV